jgi:hypothetical protein
MTSSGIDLEARKSHRSLTPVETLFTFCPPGPGERRNSNSISPERSSAPAETRFTASPSVWEQEPAGGISQAYVHMMGAEQPCDHDSSDHLRGDALFPLAPATPPVAPRPPERHAGDQASDRRAALRLTSVHGGNDLIRLCKPGAVTCVAASSSTFSKYSDAPGFVRPFACVKGRPCGEPGIGACVSSGIDHLDVHAVE